MMSKRSELYVLTYNTRVLQVIEAKTLHGAKIQASKICSNKKSFSHVIQGVFLWNADGVCVATYSPFIHQWFDMRLADDE